NPADTRLVRDALSAVHGFACDLVVVPSLSRASDLLQDGDVDVILLDLGFADHHSLAQLAVLPGHATAAPVVVLSSRDDEALALDLVAAGAQDFLFKGELTGRHLVRCVRHAIERHQMQAAIRALSLTDDLTGLYNRRGFTTLAEQQMKLARRTQRGLYLLFLDLDRFKQINDTFGHLEGDRALVQAAEVLRRTFRNSDIVARLGGDEFVVLAIDTQDDRSVLLQRLQEQLQACNARSDRGYELSFSVGWARYPADGIGSLDD